MSEKLTECPAQGTPYLIADNDSDNARYIIKARCKMWNCPYCAPVNAHQHKIRILNGVNELRSEGQRFNFITFTSHEKAKTTERCLYIWRNAWRKLRERIRRFQKASSKYALAFCIVTELHKDKRLHWHIIINCQLSNRWCKDNARACGLGYQSKSVELDNAIQGANYVTKYLTKSIAQADYPKKMRRIVYSQTFPDKPASDNKYEWGVLDAKETIVSAIEAGWKMDYDTFLNWNEIVEIVGTPYDTK